MNILKYKSYRGPVEKSLHYRVESALPWYTAGSDSIVRAAPWQIQSL